MAAQRKQTPNSPAQRVRVSESIGPTVDRGLHHRATPLPESRDRPTRKGLDARKVGTRVDTASAAEGSLQKSVPAPAVSSTRWAESSHWEKAPVSRDEQRQLKTQPAEARPRDDLVGPASAHSRLTDAPAESIGYYSMGSLPVDEVKIPKAPRMPRVGMTELDLEPIQPGAADSFSKSIDRAPLGHRSPIGESLVPKTLRGSHSEASFGPETIRTPPPGPGDGNTMLDAPEYRRPSSLPPEPIQESPSQERPTSRPPSPSNRRTLPPPRIYFSAQVRIQAKKWLDTGSLSLPGCPSPRHARALQRALLLAILHEPGWNALPEGLRQRAGWLFCDGWESSAGASHVFREIDDLSTVLGLPCCPDTRRTLVLAISGVVLQTGPARSSHPPSRRRSPSSPPSSRG